MNELIKRVYNWLRDHQKDVDKCIADAGRAYVEEFGEAEWFAYQSRGAQEGLLGLGHGNDYAYDQPSCGFVYASWYQGLRINTNLTAITESMLIENKDRALRIFDLGAGTGALQIAVGLVLTAMEELREMIPGSVQMINVDTSPFMLDFNRRFLWPRFCESFSACERIRPEYEVSAWHGEQGAVDLGTTWVSASYLFDYRENFEHLCGSFEEHLDRLRPQRVFLSTAIAKEEMLCDLSSRLCQGPYEPQQPSMQSAPFSGLMTQVQALRDQVGRDHQIRLVGSAKWNDRNHCWRVLRATEPGLATKARNPESQEVALFEPPLKVRREVVLNDEQRKAAKNTGRPTLIKGPAGCGKSVVITERIKNLVDEHRGALTQEKLRILVTTFNKGMTRQLWIWLEDLLELQAEVPQAYLDNPHYEFHTSTYDIYVMHFDVLPTRLRHILNGLPIVSRYIDIRREAEYHHGIIRESIEELRQQGIEPPSGERETDIADPRFILEEYHRVVFAQELKRREKYFQASRRGRNNPKLKRGGKSREFLWSVIKKYAWKLKRSNTHSFITLRSKFLRILRNHDLQWEAFSHIFVDEFQDCTFADFELLYELLNDPNHFVIAGDYAQAVHLGTSAKGPRYGGAAEQRNFKYVTLSGSYRLPYWVCRGIIGISEKVVEKHDNGADFLDAYKGAPPGARPIIVAAANAASMARKIKRIKEVYHLFDLDLDPITIMEKDCELYWALKAQGCRTPESTTILRLKGLEKTCVVWSTRGEVTQVSDVEEFVYTILTRTSCLLIIALYPDWQKEFRPILKALNQPDLNFWDKESEARWRSIE